MFQIFWPCSAVASRPAYFKPITHQTLIGKALFEHSLECSTIAAVAGVSPNFRNSSLGPNLLALVQSNSDNKDLFLNSFFPSLNSTLQFANAIFISSSFDDLLAQRLCQTKYFGMNDLKLQLCRPSSSVVTNLFQKCKKIVDLTVELDYRSRYYVLRDQVDFFGLENSFRSFDGSRLKKLSLNLGLCVDDASTVFKNIYERCPHLEELSIVAEGQDFSNIFSILTFQDIQNSNSTSMTNNTIQTHHPHLTSLSLALDTSPRTFDHDAYQNIFCGVLLQQDQLQRLSLDFSHALDEDDWTAFNGLTFNNLIMKKSPWGILPRQCLGNPNFNNLKVVEVKDFFDDDLVLLGNQCFFMEDLAIGVNDLLGAFLSDSSLVPEAFSQVRSFSVNCHYFVADSMGDGFSRFKSLEKLILDAPRQADVVAAFFRHLPNPLLLKYLEISCPYSNAIANDIFSTYVSKLFNLEVFILEVSFVFGGHKMEVTEKELLKLVALKKLKKLSYKHSDDRRCFSSSSIIRLVEQLPNLNRLEVSRCCSFTEASVKKLSAHRFLQDLFIGPVLMLKSKTRNKTRNELFQFVDEASRNLEKIVRKEHPHFISFNCWFSSYEFEDDEQEDNVSTDARRRQRNEDDEEM